MATVYDDELNLVPDRLTPLPQRAVTNIYSLSSRIDAE